VKWEEVGMGGADESFRKRLEEEREHLAADMRRLGVTEQDNPGYSTHIADDATEVLENAKNHALRRNLQRLLDQVNDALAKIDKGTYGLCEECGSKIDRARLKALPYATSCIQCQKQRERSARNQKGSLPFAS
jgi:DnaK suppressor protein